jgi:hypothetical protein
MIYIEDIRKMVSNLNSRLHRDIGEPGYITMDSYQPGNSMRIYHLQVLEPGGGYRPTTRFRMTKREFYIYLTGLHDALDHSQFYSLFEILSILVDHAEERYPHFESDRGQREIQEAKNTIQKSKGQQV